MLYVTCNFFMTFVKKYKGYLSLLLLIFNISCTMHAQIQSLDSTTTALPELRLKVQQNNNQDALSVEEGTLILATAILDKAQREDLNISVFITSPNGDARVAERIGNYTKSVVIPAGSISAFITIQTTNDLIYQGDDEEFKITIKTQEQAGLKNDSSSLRLIIKDNESLPELSFLTSSQNRNEDSGTNQISIELSRITDRTVTARVVAEDISTAAGTDYNFTSQIVTFAPGEISKNVTFILINRPGIQISRQFRLKLTDVNNAFVTTNTTGSNTKDHLVTILDIDRPTLAIDNISINEGAQAQFTVNVSSPFSDTISVHYSTQAVSAVAGTDFTLASGDLIIPANATSGTISISTLINPAICDGNKTFKVILSAPVNASLGTTEGVGTIQDISVPSVQFTSSTSSVTEGAVATLTAQLSTVCPTRSVDVRYSTSVGTGFTNATNALLTIPAGTLSENISIPTIDDSTDNPDETFTVTLSSPNNATLGATQTITVTIQDNDAPPTVTLTSSAASISENGGSVTLTATLSAISGKNITLPFSISGTATLATDYTLAPSSPLSIPAGSISTTMTLTSVDDSALEGNETIQIDLTTPTHATLGSPYSQSITITDDDLGAFTISGVTGSGDAIEDANLSNTLVPEFKWTSSNGATGYKVRVLSDDLNTTICAEQSLGNVLSFQYTAMDCTLSAGTYYRVRVQATLSAIHQNASNTDYRFLVNSSPTLASNGDGPWYVMAGSSITINAVGGASPTIGVASDPDGDTIGFSATGTGSLGTVGSASASSFTYTVPSSQTLHGQDTITYTISDSRGGTRSGSILINVMQPYTWTGKSSTAWATALNWCGSVASNKRSCDGSGSSPNASSSSINIYFDQTCTSSFTCSPSTSSDVSVKGIKIKANGFSQGNGFTLTVGADGWTQSDGTFTGSSGTTVANAITTESLLVSQGNFKSTAATLTVSGNLSIASGVTFDHNSGTIKIIGTSNVSVGTAQLFNLHTAANHVNFGGQTVSVNNNFSIEGGYGFYFNNGTVEVKHNLNMLVGLGYGVNGTAVVKMIGSPSGSTIYGETGSAISNITIDTGTNPVVLSGEIFISGSFGNGSFNYISSGTFTSTGSTLSGYNGFNFVPGSVEYHHLKLPSTNLNAATVTLNGDLTLLGGYNSWISNGTIVVKGNINCQSSDGYPNYGDALIKLISKAGGSTITGTPACGIPSLEIDTGAYPVTLSGTLPINGSGGPTSVGTYKVTSTGSLTTTGSHIIFNASGTSKPGNYSYNNITFALPSDATINLSSSNMSVYGTLNIAAGRMVIDQSTINIYGSLNATGSASGSALFTARGDAAGGVQYITSASASATIPNLVISSGTKAISFSSTLAVYKNFRVLSSGTITAPNTLYTYCYGCTFVLNMAGNSLNNVTVVRELVTQTFQLLGTPPLVLTGELNAVDGVIIDMNGKNLTTNSLTLTSSVLTKAGGTLTVNGSTVGTGSLYGGTINP